jgi:hypothetical protein
VIRKRGSKYVVKSESGRNLSKPLSKAAAQKRLAEVEMFKHMKGRQRRDRKS